jgi:hypothetical protein
MEIRPLTTSDLDSTLINNRNKPFSPLPTQTLYTKLSKPLFSQEFETYDTRATQSTPFSQYAPSLSPNVQPQQSFKPTQNQIPPQLAASQQSNKLGFSLMSEQGEEKPEENDFYEELWEFNKNFKKRVLFLFLSLFSQFFLFIFSPSLLYLTLLLLVFLYY